MSSPPTDASSNESKESNGGVRPKATLSYVLVRVVGGVAFGGLIAALVLTLSADIREQTHQFLGHTRARRDHEAYALTTRAFQQRVPEAAFSAYLDRNVPGVRASSGEWINGSQGGTRNKCMEVWLHDTPQETVYVLLVKEDRAWRVDEVTHFEVAGCGSD